MVEKITTARPIPHIPASVRGSDGGRAQGEARAKEKAPAKTKKGSKRIPKFDINASKVW